MPRTTRTLILFSMLTGCTLFGRATDTRGRFELSRGDGREGANVPAVATWCERDSTLTVLAVAPDGDGGVSARTVWPPAADTLKVQTRLDSLRTATVAWRVLKDSVSTALKADSGSLLVRGDTLLDGTFSAWATLFDTATVRLDGALRAVRVTRDCGAPQQ